MVKKLIVVVGLFMLTHSLFAQKFMHGVGTGVVINLSPFIEPSFPTVLTYAPRINVFENKALSVSAGIPFSIGFGSSYYQRRSSSGELEVKNTSTFVLNVPAIVNLNVGAGASKQSEKRFGYFIGGGYAYQYGTYVLQQSFEYLGSGGKAKETSSGPIGNIGMRFAVGKHQKNIEAKFSYMRSLREDKTSVLGIVALFNF